MTIRFKWPTFLEWLIYRDGPEFVAKFGDILRILEGIVGLAALTVTEMSRFMGIDPFAEEVPIVKAPFLGAHLRSESDVLDFWPSFNTKSNGYLEEAETHQLKHVYIAAGTLVIAISLRRGPGTNYN